MQGLSTVRALDAQKLLTKEFDDHQNLHTSAFYLLTAVYCALGFWTDVACVLYIAFVTFSFFAFKSGVLIVSNFVSFVQFMF
jgi:ATP-binding cassette subfamily C (CFTR/MRP) protein 4